MTVPTGAIVSGQATRLVRFTRVWGGLYSETLHRKDVWVNPAHVQRVQRYEGINNGAHTMIIFSADDSLLVAEAPSDVAYMLMEQTPRWSRENAEGIDPIYEGWQKDRS